MSAPRGWRHKVSWVLLSFVASVVLALSVASAWLAYSGRNYPIAGEPIFQAAGRRAEIEVGLRGIRGTSAAYALAFAGLMLAIAVGPYRAGAAWSWWALLAANLAILVTVWLRVPTLGTQLGIGSVVTHTGLALFALLLDVGRWRGSGG